MENLEFILGALSMIGLLGLGYAVMGVFKVTQRSNGFNEAIDGIHRNMEDNHRELHLRIDGEIGRVDKLHDHNIRYSDELNKNCHESMTEIYRYIDSRFDKFENRLKKIDKDGCEPVKKSKQILTD
jgi:hypothetical protein